MGWSVPKIVEMFRRAVAPAHVRANATPGLLNEAINFEKKCIFVSVPKTGTTSVRVQLRQQGVPLIANPHLNIVQLRDSLYVWFLMQALGQTTSFPTESTPSDASLRAQASQTFNSFFKFSAVRNPWARAVSLYSRREGVRIEGSISFEEFCQSHLFASDTCRQPTLHQNQLDWLCDENGVNAMDYVYKLEDFDRAIKEISELTNGRVNLSENNANRNPDSLSRSYRDLYSSASRKLIAQRFERDIDYFGCTF